MSQDPTLEIAVTIVEAALKGKKLGRTRYENEFSPFGLGRITTLPIPELVSTFAEAMKQLTDGVNGIEEAPIVRAMYSEGGYRPLVALAQTGAVAKEGTRVFILFFNGTIVIHQAETLGIS